MENQDYKTKTRPVSYRHGQGKREEQYSFSAMVAGGCIIVIFLLLISVLVSNQLLIDSKWWP